MTGIHTCTGGAKFTLMTGVASAGQVTGDVQDWLVATGLPNDIDETDNTFR